MRLIVNDEDTQTHNTTSPHIQFLTIMSSCLRNFQVTCWEPQRDSSTVAGLALYQQMTVVIFYQAARNRQSQPNTMRLGGKEWLKNMLELIGSDTDSCITHR